MNLPNKLTVLRVVLIPFFMLFYLWQSLPMNYFWALLLFAAASLTDMLDGQIARKYHLITDFGKFMDPLADKLLVMSAMLCFVQDAITPAWVVALVLAREFAVTGFRTIAAGKGVVIAADRWGKIKTISQMVWILYGLAMQFFNRNLALGFALPLQLFTLLTAIVVIATTGSGCNYFYKNRSMLSDC